MSIMLNGAKYAIATVLAEAVAISNITNAAPPLALAADTPVQGNIVLLKSGWGELDESPARVGTVVADTSFQLVGYDATDLNRFPAGEGLGNYILASGFVNLPKIHDIQKSGGEQNYATRQYVSDPSPRLVNPALPIRAESIKTDVPAAVLTLTGSPCPSDRLPNDRS